MKDRYEIAGKWNILCGGMLIAFLALLALPVVWGFLFGQADSNDALLGEALIELFFLGVFVVLFLFYAVWMIIIGKNMREGYTEKWSIKILFWVNDFLKFEAGMGVFAVGVLAIAIGSLDLNSGHSFLYAIPAVFGVIVDVCLVISLVMDLRAFFQKKKRKR